MTRYSKPHWRTTRFVFRASIAFCLAAGLACARLASAQTEPEPEPIPQPEPQTLPQPPPPPPPPLPAPVVAQPSPPPSTVVVGATTGATVTSGPGMLTCEEPPKRVREGFYLRVGSGIGFFRLQGTGPNGSASVTSLGSSSTIAIGGNVTRGFVLAAVMRASTASAKFSGGPLKGATLTLPNQTTSSASDKADAVISELGMMADWYPNPSQGWHTGLSAGLGSVSITNHASDQTYVGVGFTGTAFGGYDWSIGSQWSMGLQLVASGVTSSTLRRDNNDTGYRMKGVSVGIQGSLLYF